MSTVQVKPV